MFLVVGFFGFASSEMEEIVLIHDLKALTFLKKNNCLIMCLIFLIILVTSQRKI